MTAGTPRQTPPSGRDDDDVVVAHHVTFQGLTIWCGDSMPVHVDDFMDSGDLRDLIRNPTLRAVTVARLRSVADLLEREDQADE